MRVDVVENEVFMMSPTGPIPIRLILDGQNDTVLTGSIRILPDSPSDDVRSNATTSEEEGEYDYHGAMLFSVLVITVYAISIVLLIASFIKKKQVLVSMEESKNVNQYLIQVSDLKEKTARENFKKLKRSIIEAVERSDSRRQPSPNGNGQENGRKGDSQALKHAILGAGISLYSPLIVIKEEEGEDGRATSRTVSADIEVLQRSGRSSPRRSSPRRGSPRGGSPRGGNSPKGGRSPRGQSPVRASPRFLYPPSGSVTPDSPSGSDQPLLNSPTSPGTDSRKLLLDSDSPSSASPMEVPSEPIWQTRDELNQGYRNASFLPSPPPKLSRQKRVIGPPKLFSDVWVPLGEPSSRTPSPSRQSGGPAKQENAVSSV